jgi:hypothetical protein
MKLKIQKEVHICFQDLISHSAYAEISFNISRMIITEIEKPNFLDFPAVDF